MDKTERDALVRETEQRVRREIAEKMRADRMAPVMIKKYTGIDWEEDRAESDREDAVAKQVACEMMLRGLPLDQIAAATRVPYSILQELWRQIAD